jgi:hypothetical protein
MPCTPVTKALIDERMPGRETRSMKPLIPVVALVVAIMGQGTQAQERLSRAQSLKYAFFASLDLKEMLATPIPTDPDVKRPVAIRHGDHGLLLLPETRFNAALLEKAGPEVIPVGQLWLVKVAPKRDGELVPSSKLRMVDVKTDTGQGSVACCALGVRKKGDGMLELLVYGKDKVPLLATPLKGSSVPQAADTPIDISAETKEDGAVVTLKLAGKYEAGISVGHAEE